ncbi:MAG: ComF family protein [Gammaproteobacteria bacterium]|nr:ComF family protein [Gammaproteobacteria bacterium]
MNPNKLWTSSLEAVRNLYICTKTGLSSGQRCRLCLAPSAEALCKACLSDLPWLPTAERIKRRAFGQEMAAFSYEFPLNALIVSAKYQGGTGLCRLLGDLAARSLGSPGPPVDCLVPVPMPWPRVLRRGYNHADEIALGFANSWKLPLRHDLLKRSGWQPPQRGSSRRERKNRLGAAFTGDAGVAGCAVMLVDDVSTTGSTLEACARALQKAGAARVDAVVVARTA